MYDSHIHLTDELVLAHLPEVLREFQLHGGKDLLNIAQDFEYIYKSVELDNIPANMSIFHSFGLHPGILTADRTERDVAKDLRKLERAIDVHSEYVSAIGECGFDFFRASKSDFEKLYTLQYLLFEGQIRLAVDRGLPLVIHARDVKGEDIAVKSALALLTEHNFSDPVVFHSYTGTADVLETIIAQGYYIGVNAIVTYPSGKDVRELLNAIPIEQILLETDSPYLPTQTRRQLKHVATTEKFGRPVDILEIAEVVAETKGLTAGRVIDTTYENFRRFLMPPA